MQVKIWRCVLTALLVLSLICSCYAAGPIDAERVGSISVLIEYNDHAVSGGTLTAYHIAVPTWIGEDYVFEFTQSFDNCELSLSELDQKETAIAFSEYVLAQSISGITRRINMDGEAKFENLPVGLYLIIQEQAANGYFPIEPFLISIPMMEGDKWIYDVDATPKIDIEREPQPINPPKPPDIPQTGQLKWPIPLLTISGIVFFALGWALIFKSKKKKDEA